MQVNFDGITSIVPGEVSKFFQSNGVPFFTRRLTIHGPKGRVDHVVLFADTEAALALPGEKEADPLLSPPREPLLSPPRRKIGLQAEAGPPCPICAASGQDVIECEHSATPPMELPF